MPAMAFKYRGETHNNWKVMDNEDNELNVEEATEKAGVWVQKDHNRKIDIQEELKNRDYGFGGQNTNR